MLRKIAVLKTFLATLKGENTGEKLGELGGVMQKMGQLAYLNDMSRQELYALVSRGSGHASTKPGDDIKKALSLEDKPFSCASIGQVYRGTYGGRSIVLKLQNPNIKKRLLGDIAFLTSCTNTSLRFLFVPRENRVNLKEYVAVLAETFKEETDYKREANMAKKFYNIYSGQPDFVLPEVIDIYTNEQMICQTEVHGVLLADYLKTAPPEKIKTVVELLCRFTLSALFEYGIVHGDPHPGNFFVLEQGGTTRLGVVDFGSAQHISPATLKAVLGIPLSIKTADPALMESSLNTLGITGEQAGEYKTVLPSMLTILFEPFLADGAFDFDNWRMEYKLNTLMCSKPFRGILKIGREPLLILRTLSGLLSYIEICQDQIFDFSRWIYEK